VGTLLPPRHERPWICVAYSALWRLASAVFLYLPIRQGSFSMACLGISGTFNFMLVFQAQHNILMQPLPHVGVARVFFGATPVLGHARRRSLVTSSLGETTESEGARTTVTSSAKSEETYTFVAARTALLRRLISSSTPLSIQQPQPGTSLLTNTGRVSWASWFTAPWLSEPTMAFNLKRFQAQSADPSMGKVRCRFHTLADSAEPLPVLVAFGSDAQERNARTNFPHLSLASARKPPPVWL